MGLYSNLYGCRLTSIKMNQFTLGLKFSPQGQIDISEYWELKDGKGQVVDRSLGEKLRTSCSLHQIMNRRLLNVETCGSMRNLNFEGQFQLTFFDQSARGSKVVSKFLRWKTSSMSMGKNKDGVVRGIANEERNSKSKRK